MKKSILNFTLLLFLFLVSCNTDNPSPEPEPSVVSLTFTQETAQDQMGDFADNAMEIFNSKVWSFAGAMYDPTPYHHNVWFSNNGIAWVSVADNVPIGRRGTTLTKFNDKLWIIGGEDNDGNALQDIWSSSDGEHWNLITDSAVFGDATFHTTVVFNSRIYLIKGNRTSGFTEVWSSVNGTDWTQNTSNAFSSRGGHKAVVFNDAMYVIGGEDILNNKLNEIWKSTNGTDWQQVSVDLNKIFTPRNGHTATVYNGKVWVIGGRTDTALFNNDIWYSSNMIEWYSYLETVPFTAITSHNVLTYNNALWLFGGYKNGGLSGAIWKIKEE